MMADLNQLWILVAAHADISKVITEIPKTTLGADSQFFPLFEVIWTIDWAAIKQKVV